MNDLQNILQEDSVPAMCVVPRAALTSILNIATKSAVDNTLRELGLLKDEISQREAHRIFGSGNVISLLNRRLIKRIVGKGERSKITYYRSQIENALKMDRVNLLTN